MGKSIDKRLSELGGQRLQPLECADEATNLEETVERWKAAVTALVRNFLAETSAPPAPKDLPCEAKGDVGVCVATSESPLCAAVEQLSLASASSGEARRVDYEAALLERMGTIPTGLQQLKTIAAAIGLDSDAFDSLVAGHVPAPSREKHDATKAELLAGEPSDATVQPPRSQDLGCGLCAERPFAASVVGARWLTEEQMSRSSFDETADSWGEGKRVVALEFSLGGADIEYEPGDAIAFCCPNPRYAVDVAFRRLAETHGAALSMASVLRLSSGGKEETLTVEELLLYRLDLCGLPKKTQIAQLARCCTDERESRQMSLLCGREAQKKQLFTAFVEQQALNIAELLFLFPSCKLSLEQLASIALPMVPRYYSLASSPLAQGEVATVAFSLVRYRCRVGQLAPVLRHGVCTLFLESLLSPWLYPKDGARTDVQLRVFHRSTPHFHLPSSQAVPLILIGPGTGVAPFIGFLQHREAQQRDRYQRLHPCHSSSDKLLDLSATGAGGAPVAAGNAASSRRRKAAAVSELMSEGVWRGGFELDSEDLPCEGNGVESFLDRVPCGDITLFFGSRDDRDFLFSAELNNFTSAGVLTRLHTAFSRIADRPKMYVTQRILEHGAAVAEALVTQQAAVYICGDGNAMAKDVMRALEEILVQYGHCEDLPAAQALLNTLKTRKRLNLDIWS